jgi:hypothetical protein
MQDFQEHTTEPYPLFIKEKYYEEINHPEQHDEEQSFPTVPVYDDYESDPWESYEEEKEQQKGQFISCPEPVSEQPSSEVSQPASASHPPELAREIQQCVSSCVAEKAACYKFSGVCRLSYEPVKEYMELYFLHVLKPPSFILTSSLGGKLKNVTVLLSRLHSLLSIIDRVNKFAARKLLEWLWWKFAFT